MELSQVIEMDHAYYMNTFGNRIELMFERGEGCKLTASDGRVYTDFLAGIAVNALGYGYAPLAEAIARQASRLLHCSNYFYIENQALLAQKLCENSCADKVFFGNSGAEANEGAIKLARRFFHAQEQDRYEIISANNSFHGRTLATLAATGQEKYRAPYRPAPGGFINVPYGDIEAVRGAMTEHTAAVFMEPIQGEGGVIDGGADYLRALRALCDETGALLIFDEIQTGMGRTGKFLACQHAGVEPDIFTLAKALGGGVPIGAVLCKAHVSRFQPGDHGSTFGGNPLACAAGLAMLGGILADGFLGEVARKGERLAGKLRALQGACDAIAEVRGRGLLLGVQLTETFPAAKVQKAALNRGFICGTAGGNTLRLVPPLIVSDAEIDALTDTLAQIFAKGVDGE